MPNHLLKSVDPIRRLSGLVGSVRIVGFHEIWTAETILALMNRRIPHGAQAMDGEHLKRHRPSDLYPKVPGQSAFYDFGANHGGIRQIKHEEATCTKGQGQVVWKGNKLVRSTK